MNATMEQPVTAGVALANPSTGETVCRRQCALLARLASVNAESAEMLTQIEHVNVALEATNREVTRANAHAAELMAELELKNLEIAKLNHALAHATARAAELLVEEEIRKAELEQLNQSLGQTNVELRESNHQLEIAQERLRCQTVRLLETERQRVMLESLGAACHHLAQPLTVLMGDLEMLSDTGVTDDQRKLLDECLGAALSASELLRRFQDTTAYRTEPYLSSGAGSPRSTRILSL
jgi:signal transduction histidine kinase